MNPPLRTEDDRRALIEALRDGTIECIATDHAPHARDEKDVPFEQAPLGTTGLETAFAVALHRARAARRIDARTLLRAPHRGGAAPARSAGPAIAVGAPANPCLIDLDAALADRRGRLREPLGELLLRRSRGQGRVAPDARRRRRRLPRARLRAERRMSYALLLEDGTRFDGERCRRARRGDGRGRLQHLDVGLSGVDDRPLLRAPDDHLHLPAHRQLRRQRGGDGIRPRPRPRRRSCATPATTPTRPAPRAAGSTGCATEGVPAITGVDTRALVRHIRDARRDARGDLPGGAAQPRARAWSPRSRSMDGRRPRPRGHARGAVTLDPTGGQSRPDGSR